jgi:hypothetical protein
MILPSRLGCSRVGRWVIQLLAFNLDQIATPEYRLPALAPSSWLELWYLW